VVDPQGAVSISDRLPQPAGPPQFELEMQTDEDEERLAVVSPETTPDQKSPYNRDAAEMLASNHSWKGTSKVWKTQRQALSLDLRWRSPKLANQVTRAILAGRFLRGGAARQAGLG